MGMQSLACLISEMSLTAGKHSQCLISSLKRCVHVIGLQVLSQQHSRSDASEDAESIASQLQPVRSGELQAKAPELELNDLEGGSMMALPKEPSTASVAAGYVLLLGLCTH